MLQKFLIANKVFLSGLAGALALALNQYLVQPTVDWMVIGYAALMATMSFIANQWRGQGVTILGVLGTLAYTFVNAQDSGHFTWQQFIFLSVVALLSMVAPPPKNLSYEKSPAIEQAKGKSASDGWSSRFSKSNVTGRRAGILIGMLLISTIAMCQTKFFAPIPKVNKVYRLLTLAPADSVKVGLRPIIQGVYALSSNGSSLLTGAGASYEHDTFHQDAQKWYTDWSIAVLFYAGGALAPTDPSAVIALGPSVSFFNKLVAVGGVYNFILKKPMATLGFSVSLNN